MFLSNKHLKLFFVILLITASIFFRFWQVRDYVVFLGDEGRDMIILRNIFVEKIIPFLGPTASVGGFYLGPIYYWMAAPFLLLWRFDPVGPSYMVAIFGVATVILLFKFLKDAVGFWPAVMASFLYSTAPLIVRYSRSSWNPNPLPFFALLLIYFIYLGISKKRLIYFLGAGASFGIAIQLHYLAAVLVIIAGLIILINTSYKNWLKIIFFLLAGFIITFSPFLLFEIRHNFPNFRTILEFVTRGSTVGYKTVNFLWIVSNTGNIFLEEVSALKGTYITKLVFWALLLGSILSILIKRNDKEKRFILSVAIIWFFVGIIGLRLYTGQIYDYYFGFMFPAPFLAVGVLFSIMWQKVILRALALAITIISLVFFASNGFYRTPPNRLINQTETVADFIIEKSEDKPFNFALITDHNSDHAYRYFLEVKGKKPVGLESMVADQLIVLCESTTCAPLGNPLWEIAGFGRAEIAGEWDLPKYNFKVYRLTHWPGAPNPAGKPAQKGG